MKEKTKDKSKTIKILTLLLIFANIILLTLPIFNFTKIIRINDITETLTIKTSFIKLMFNSEIKIISSIGNTTLKNIKIGDLWFSEEQFNNVRIAIGFLVANFIVAIAVLVYSICANFTNKNHLWYFNTAWILFLSVSILVCKASLPIHEEFFYTLEFPIKIILIYGVINIVSVIVLEKILDKEKQKAYDNFFDKYKEQSVEFQEELLANVFECIGGARYDSSLEILGQIAEQVEKIPTKSKNKSQENELNEIEIEDKRE